MENKNKIVITKVFDAPRDRVWEAWTTPETIKKWWGPKGFSAPVAKVDLREGGKYLYSMKGPDGKIYWSGGEFKKINKPNYLVITDYFTNEKGDKVDPSTYGMDPNFPKESKVTIKFEDENNKTRLEIIYQPESATEKEAMEKSRMDEGWGSSLDKLADCLK